MLWTNRGNRLHLGNAVITMPLGKVLSAISVKGRKH
jgi:hypothetical protein